MTLGDKGCIAKRKGEQEIVQEPACSGVTVTDATGVCTRDYIMQWPMHNNKS